MLSVLYSKTSSLVVAVVFEVAEIFFVISSKVVSEVVLCPLLSAEIFM